MELFKEVADLYQGTYNLNDIRNIVQKFEECVKNHLAEADKDHPIQVKAFNGISLLSWLVPEQKNAAHPEALLKQLAEGGKPRFFDAVKIAVDAGISEYVRVKSDITHYYKRKIQELATEMK